MQNSSSVTSTSVKSIAMKSHLSDAGSAAPEWLTANEAAQYLKVRVRTLLLWVRQGKVQGHALSGTERHVWRFRREELDAAFFQPASRPVLQSASSSVRSAEKEAA